VKTKAGLAQIPRRSKQRMKDLKHITLASAYCSDSGSFCRTDLNMGSESSKYVIHSPYKGYAGRRFLRSEADFPQEME
jgi:hypothetical protein